MSLSNAPEGYPKTNREGYDLFYPIGGDGKPAGRARIMFDGQTMEDMKEVREYQRRVKDWHTRPEVVWPDGTGVFFPSDLTDDDLAYLRGEVGPYGVATGGRQLSFDIMRGPAAGINHAINRGDRFNPGSNKWDVASKVVVEEVKRLTNLYKSFDDRVTTDK
jgi:hypothetical protein